MQTARETLVDLAPPSLTIIDEEPATAPPFALRAHHAGMSVPDLEASIDWYRDHLGFTVEFRTNVPQVPFTGAFLRRGDTRIELFHVPGAKPLPEERRRPETDLATHGMKHVALEVDNIRNAFAFLAARGVEIALDVISDRLMSAGYIRDNSGILIELVEHHDRRRRLPPAREGTN